MSGTCMYWNRKSNGGTETAAPKRRHRNGSTETAAQKRNVTAKLNLPFVSISIVGLGKLGQ